MIHVHYEFPPEPGNHRRTRWACQSFADLPPRVRSGLGHYLDGGKTVSVLIGMMRQAVKSCREARQVNARTGSVEVVVSYLTQASPYLDIQVQPHPAQTNALLVHIRPVGKTGRVTFTLTIEE